MKYIMLALSGIVVIFAGLGLFRILPFDTSTPIMMVSLATLLLLKSIEFKNSKDKNNFLLILLVAIFIYILVIYNIFIG